MIHTEIPQEAALLPLSRLMRKKSPASKLDEPFFLI